MSDAIRRAGIAVLIDEAAAITSQVRSDYSPLTPAQLNWRPNPEAWSVGQCFEHMTIATRAYEPIFARCFVPGRPRTLWERLPLLPALSGRLLISTLNPEFKGRVEAPQVFRPSASDVPPDVVAQFLAANGWFMGFLRARDEAQLRATIITSPASPYVTYSALDACRVIVVHARRHLAQIAATAALPAFPTSTW